MGQVVAVREPDRFFEMRGRLLGATEAQEHPSSRLVGAAVARGEAGGQCEPSLGLGEAVVAEQEQAHCVLGVR
jgi:hypothetical protein